ncbi:hypothetical protein C1J03_03115 [Sulfitobacter sp. SK012]|uniref:DUF3987 domain-containing protein n=1 Tax=Sulfitobacter sp. SK012 TaxID=1389005 RepID=UPI000E0AE8B0|nr:DUF3987 domain-containing protein [Sulfitobacter sp. SK012]AXI45113.1 hypothetical protein C1J03_03115 [Sulfitobacter sp. SK012]
MAAIQTSPAIQRNLEVAKSLASAGLPVFPCRNAANGDKGAKSPLTSDGFKSATTDVDQIERWWSSHPSAVVGVPTGAASGISVLDGDIDRKTGEPVGERQLEELGLLPPSAVKVLTQSGGVQYLFAHCEGARTSSHQVASNVDTRGDGGYIIAPGSVMADGASYRYAARKLSDAIKAGDLPTYPVHAVDAAILARKEKEKAPPSIATNLFIDTGDTRASDPETLNATRRLLAEAPNTLTREDWVKLALSLRVAYGDALHDAFLSFSERYSGGTPCDAKAAQVVWNSAAHPSSVTTIAPALALLKNAAGEGRTKEIWREVFAERDHQQPAQSIVLGKDQANTASDWPEPDAKMGEPIRPPAPVMTNTEFEQVFGPWAQWITDAAETKNAPTDYVALTLLATAGAAIGNSRWAVPWEGWKEPPVLWAMLVGDPSAGKSPALDAVLDPVKDIEREMTDIYRKARDKWADENEVAALVLSQWKQDAKSAMADGDTPPSKPREADAGSPPVRERICITDITTEKVADLLSTTWRGLLLARDELSGWLGSMDRYNGGGDRPFWLEAYGGRSYTIDRKNSPEPITVDHLSVSIIGGTQPDKLSDLLVNSDDDGLLARFIVVCPDAVPLSRPTVSLDGAKLTEAVEMLHGLPHGTDENGNRRPFFIDFSPDAADALHEFRGRCRVWEADSTGLYKSHIGKMPGLVVRIANVLAHLDWAADAGNDFVTHITVNHVGRACHFVGEYLRKHAYRAYGAAKMPSEVQAAKTIGSIIRTDDLTLFKLRDIQNKGRTGLLKTTDVKAALGVLIDADWLREIRATTGGRPSVSYSVNPKLEDMK